jgi:uncharacterized RDD family membrane protein YckC
MARRRSLDDEPSLFDLPLAGPATAEDDPGPTLAGPGPSERRAPEREPEPLDLFRAPEREPQTPASTAATNRSAARSREPAPLSTRYLAGLADLAVHLALSVALLFGSRFLGVEAGLGDWPAVVLFLLVFSFLYHVLPLAFWGQTPGMAWAGVAARARGGESLAFGQTARRWAGSLLTATLLGLPVLLAAGGRRSLADRLSDSDTYLA